MNTRLNQAAQYRYVKTTDPIDEVQHAGLKLNHYTHFTSPIRRYIDLINHRLLKGIIMDDLKNICDHANTINRQVRRFNRDVDYLKVVELLDSTPDITTEAYIIEIVKQSLKIFIPKYHLTQRIKVLDRELSHLYVFEHDDTTLKIQHDTTTVEYKLYSKILVQMVAIPKHNSYGKKLRINLEMDFERSGNGF
jgi:exoribonuclease R